MKKISLKKKIFIWAAILFSLCLFAQAAVADNSYNNDKALKGITETKAYFDLTVGEPKLLLLRLQLIDKTFGQIAEAGVTPVFIIGIRGKASNFFTKGHTYIIDSDIREKESIDALVEKLSKLGIGIEQCRIAAGLQDIDVDDFLPQVELVANGYVSMIGYQSKGYGLVPMD